MTEQEQFDRWRAEGKTPTDVLCDFLHTRMCITGYDAETVTRIMRFAREEAWREREVKLDVMEGAGSRGDSTGVVREAWE